MAAVANPAGVLEIFGNIPDPDHDALRNVRGLKNTYFDNNEDNCLTISGTPNNNRGILNRSSNLCQLFHGTDKTGATAIWTTGSFLCGNSE
jgi:hypothetical protein